MVVCEFRDNDPPIDIVRIRFRL